MKDITDEFNGPRIAELAFPNDPFHRCNIICIYPVFFFMKWTDQIHRWGTHPTRLLTSMLSVYQPAQQCECRWRWPVMWQDECHPGLGCSLPPPRSGTRPCRVSWWPPEGDRDIHKSTTTAHTNQLVTTSGVIIEVQQTTWVECPTTRLKMGKLLHTQKKNCTV